MDHPARARVAEIMVARVGGAGEERTRGSGYLVSPGWVLTAYHVVKDAVSVGVWLGAPLELVPEEGVAVEAGRVLAAPAADLALLPLSGQADDPSCEPAPFGRLVREPGPAVPVAAVGCPRFKLRPAPDRPGVLLRELDYAIGSIAALSDARTGRFAFAVDVPPGPDPDEHSPWEGMSGAAVWASGRLVGVVGQHHPREGLATLTVCPVEQLFGSASEDQLEAWLAALPQLPAAAGNLRRATPPTVRKIEVARARRAAEALVPRVLIGRGVELAALEEFACSDARWRWIQGDAFVGKTALMAWFALHPPERVDVAACFLRRASGAHTAEYALDVLTRQLALLADRPGYLPPQFPSDRNNDFADLLEEAARASAERDRQLLVLIDGLDEYDPTTASLDLADWLPGHRTLPDQAKLLTASRAGADVRLPPGHPLSRSLQRISASAAATEIQQAAHAELNRAVRTPGGFLLHLLCCLAVAGSGLTASELCALLKLRGDDPDVSEIEAQLSSSLGRSLMRLPNPEDTGTPVYAFAHDTLLTEARSRFASDLTTYEDLIDTWVDEYIEQGWPATTPRYCLDGYVDMLVRRGEGIRLAAIALDDRRRLRLLAVTGSRVADATVIAKAQRSVSMMATPNFGTAIRLALESLIVRNSLEETARPEMVAFDVRRGEVRKAIDTVKALSPEAGYWRSTYVELVAALYLTGRDDTAEALLQRARSEHPDERLADSVAARVAAERPDLAIRLVDGDSAALAAIAPSLAAHDAFAESAIRSVGGQPELQLAVACALAPRQPKAALRTLNRFTGFPEWSAGSKLWRDSSFARVEAARAMKSADAALDVLAAERDGNDCRAAQIAMGALLAKRGRGAEVASSLNDGISPSSVLAQFACGEETTLLVDQAIAGGRTWTGADLDLLQRFDPVLATSPRNIRADYARLLRSVRSFGAERREQAAVVILTQLLMIDDLRDGDAELLAEHFDAARIPVHDAYGAAASRIALVEPRRAAALAVDSGPTSTSVLRDVLRDIAARDLRLAIELTDTVSPEFSVTRSVILGAVGGLADPRDTKIIDELNRRIAPPESSWVVAYVLADAGLRVAAQLPDGDARARQLLERFSHHTDTSVGRYTALGRWSRIERAISLAIAGDADAAVQMMREGDNALSQDSRIREGWARLAKHLPAELASNVLQHQVLPRAAGPERHRAICALASLDPKAAIHQLLEYPLVPRTFAAVLHLADESLTDDTARDQIRLEVERLMVEAPGDTALLLRWSADRTSLATFYGAAPLRPGYELLWSRLKHDDAHPIVNACDQAQLEPALFIGAWVYDRPHRLPQAVDAIIERFHSELFSRIPKRVAVLVDAAAHADIAAANAVIDDIEWRPTPEYELLRDQSYKTLVAELAHCDRDAAYQRASAIEDPWVAARALAALAAAIAAGPIGGFGPTLSDVLAISHSRARSTIDFARDLISGLTLIDYVEPYALMTLLAETSAWPVADSIYEFGPLFSLLRQGRAAVAAAADAIMASHLAAGGLGTRGDDRHIKVAGL